MAFSILYRPQSLDEFVGNGVIKSGINDIISNNKYAHILLEGETGSGKTTLAYIIASSFGATRENIYDINCIDIGINDLRVLLDSLVSPSIFGNRKVVILDEVHGVSAASKSLLLKPMESLPSEILFIACTNEPQKLPKPLLDRFTYKFKVLPLNNTDAKELIYRVAKQEEIQLPKWKLQDNDDND